MKNNTKVVGKNGVYAEVIQSSITPSGKRVDTVSVCYWLATHAESLRHRQLSRCVKSNRAIPMKTIRKEVLNTPYVPVWFGGRQRGMVADKEMGFKALGKQLWLKCRYLVCGVHWLAEKAGAHKEWANRLLNPWQYVRETITATEWDNLYNLRLDGAAQKDIQEVTRCIKEALDKVTPMQLNAGEWHVPYVHRVRDEKGVLRYLDNGRYAPPVFSLAVNATASELQDICYDNICSDKQEYELTEQEAIKCSAARCARSSYDNHDGVLSTLKGSMGGKPDEDLYKSLVEDKPMHASATEHPCTPMEYPVAEECAEMFHGLFGQQEGITHVDTDGNYWSGNFKGWVQHRQTLKNHTCYDYEEAIKAKEGDIT